MQDFDELRKLAREKRDQAIKDARDEYRITLADINALQHRPLQKPSQKGTRSLSSPVANEFWTSSLLIGDGQ